ncbi:MAG: molybdopterin-dependent oxidoreductase [Parvibaculaceae bacterium]|nr:molybdopterin-dependent oxidoreductase [Parvibaculaceae bacterium]
MKRRTFLLGAGAVVGFPLAGCVVTKIIPVLPKRPMPDGQAAMGWIHFEEGNYFLDLPRIEMGQNITTGLKQVACEELGIEWGDLEVRMQQTSRIERVRSTVGSESVANFAIPLAQACATLRDAISEGKLKGRLDLIERPLSELKMFNQATKVIGKSPRLEHVEKIVRGEPLYAADMRLKGMLFGRVLRAPIAGDIPSAPKGWNKEAASAITGFVSIVSEGIGALGRSKGIGIVAKTPGALDRIADALNVEWSVEDGPSQAAIEAALDIDEVASKGAFSNIVQDVGNVAEGSWDVDLRFDIPAAAHAAIEPRAAVSNYYAKGKVELWVGNQDIFFVRDVIAKHLSLSQSDVIVNAQRVGGGFGGKSICTVELEAAVLSRAVGVPVKVQWTREQEFAQAFHRPPSSHRIQVALENKKMSTWHHRFVSSHILLTNAAAPEWIQALADTFVGDMGVARGAKIPYAVENQRTEYDLVRLPYFTGPWRGLGAGPNALAVESAVDECASQAISDPIEFRLRHLKDERLRRVLERVRNMSGWRTRGAANSQGMRRGMGVACGVYKDMSYSATVVGVLVSDKGEVKIEHIWCAQDSGLIINPDQVRAQCEGNHVWGIGMVLTDGLTYSDFAIEESQFSDAPIPRLSSIPPMTIELLEQGDPPAGAGETSIVSAAAALANAICDATGHRIVKFPVSTLDLEVKTVG